MNRVETLRHGVVSSVLDLETLKKVWPTWQPLINKHINLSKPITDQSLMDLGNDLNKIFTSSSTGIRSQSAVSSGGTAWEALVCWYLNLCLVDSQTVVIKQNKKFVPTPISDCTTVTYGTVESNTESDLIGITFPTSTGTASFNGSIKKLNEDLSDIVKTDFGYTEVVVIQCKSNWNDNAQIPMLWDLIYASKGFATTATVGKGGFSHNQLKQFKYAFVTAPTTDQNKINHSSVCVQRVRNLSGGNYWGLPTKSSVALNLFDMLNKNFSSGLSSYTGGWNARIGTALTQQIKHDNYFKV